MDTRQLTMTMPALYIFTIYFSRSRTRRVWSFWGWDSELWHCLEPGGSKICRIWYHSSLTKIREIREIFMGTQRTARMPQCTHGICHYLP